MASHIHLYFVTVPFEECVKLCSFAGQPLGYLVNIPTNPKVPSLEAESNRGNRLIPLFVVNQEDTAADATWKAVPGPMGFSLTNFPDVEHFLLSLV